MVMVELNELTPTPVISTYTLEHHVEDFFEAQLAHSLPANEYQKKTDEWVETSVPDSFPNVTKELRQLSLTTTSILTSRLERSLAQLEIDSTSDSTRNMRARGINAFDLAPLLVRATDQVSLETGLDYLTFFCNVGLKTRFLLDVLETYVLPKDHREKGQKLLVLDAIPLSAFLVKLISNITYIETATLHSGLTDEERVTLARKFNDPDDLLLVLVVMYGVSSAGANLDGCCSLALVFSVSHNAARACVSMRQARVVSYHKEVVLWR